VKYHPTRKQRLALWLLERVERFFLHAHGWERAMVFGQVVWFPPADYAFKRPKYKTRGHAINAQKQLIYNPAYGGTESEQPG
jgi:hypothetical protein